MRKIAFITSVGDADKNFDEQDDGESDSYQQN